MALTLVSSEGPLGPGMALRVCRPQTRGLYPSVDLGRRDTRVSQQLLDGPQVRPALQQVGGEGVPERVRVHAGLGGGVARPDPQAAPDVRCREPPAALGEEQRLVAI